MPAAIVYAPAVLAHTRFRYERGDPVPAIAADNQIHVRTLQRLAKREGWQRGAVPVELSPAMALLARAETLEAQARGGDPPPCQAEGDPHPGPPPCRGRESAAPAAAAPPLLAAAIAELEAAVVAEIRQVRRERAALGRAPQRPVDAHHLARTLSTLTQTVQTLQRLRHGLDRAAGAYPDDDDMPEDIDEFRRELARRITAFMESRAPGGDDAGADHWPAPVD